MSTSWDPQQIAKAVGLAGSAWLSGNIAGISLISVRALAQSHEDDAVPASTIARQWHLTYETGKKQNPPVAIATAAAFAYLAWTTTTTTTTVVGPSQLYTTAAALTLGIVPFTLIVMESTNGRLRAKAAKAVSSSGGGGGKGVKDDAAWTAADDQDVGALLRSWISLNHARSLFPLLGFAAAALAVLA